MLNVVSGPRKHVDEVGDAFALEHGTCLGIDHHRATRICAPGHGKAGPRRGRLPPVTGGMTPEEASRAGQGAARAGGPVESVSNADARRGLDAPEEYEVEPAEGAESEVQGEAFELTNPVQRARPVVDEAAERAAAHTCHAAGCTTHCKPEMLMCGKHWRMVPERHKAAVWMTYRPGQCDDMRPSFAWHAAADEAIAAVARLEGKVDAFNRYRESARRHRERARTGAITGRTTVLTKAEDLPGERTWREVTSERVATSVFEETQPEGYEAAVEPVEPEPPQPRQLPYGGSRSTKMPPSHRERALRQVFPGK